MNAAQVAQVATAGPHPVPLSPPVRVVAVEDTTGVTRRLLPAQFTDLPSGRLGVLARPGMRRDGWLAADLLAALGCRDAMAGAGRAGEGDWDHVAAWLLTHQVRHLYVRHAWTLPLHVLDTLLALLERVPFTLWLVGDTRYTDRHADTLRPWTERTVTGEEFLTHGDPVLKTGTAISAGGAASPEQALKWPDRVPDDDFTTFRAACRQLLDPAAFAVVDAHLRAHVPEAEQRARTLPDDAAAREVTVAAWLHEHWEQTESMAAFIVLVRAAQVGFFRAGWHLQVDLDHLVGTASTMPRRALRTPELWQRLRAYPEPHRGAVCALAASGLAVDTISGLTLGDIDHDIDHDADAGHARVLLADGTTVQVAEPARLFLTAQVHLRRHQDHDQAALLFPTRQGKPLSGQAIAQVINDARRELGVAIAPDRCDRKPVTGDRWFTRWGVSLTELS